MSMKTSRIGNLYIAYCAASPLLCLLQNIRIFQATSFIFSLITIIAIFSNPKQEDRSLIIAVLTLAFLSGAIHSFSWSGLVFDFICSGLLFFPFLRCKQLIAFARPVFTLGIALSIPFLSSSVYLDGNLSNMQRFLRLGELNDGEWYSLYLAISSFARLFTISMLFRLLPTDTNCELVNSKKILHNRLQAAFLAFKRLIDSTVVWWSIHIAGLVLTISLGLTLLKVQIVYEALLSILLYLTFSFRLKPSAIFAMMTILLSLSVFAFNLTGESVTAFIDKIAYGSEQSRIQESITFWNGSSFLDFILGHGLGGSSGLYEFGGALHIGHSNLLAKFGIIGISMLYYTIFKRLMSVPAVLKRFYSASFLLLIITSAASPNYGIYPLASILVPFLLCAPKGAEELY